MLQMQRANLQPFQFAEQLMVITKLQTQLCSNLVFRRRSSQPCRQHADRLFDGPSLAAQIARAPVERPQTVKNGPAYTELSIAAKLHLLGWIKLLKRIQESKHPRTYQLFHFHMLRQPLMNTPCNVAHHRQVLQHNLLLLRSKPASIPPDMRPAARTFLPRFAFRFRE